MGLHKEESFFTMWRSWSMGKAHLMIRDNLQMFTGLKAWYLFNGQSKTSGIHPHQKFSFGKKSFIYKYFYRENYNKVVHYQRKKLYSGTELFKNEDENPCFLLISSYIFPIIPWYFPAGPKIQQTTVPLCTEPPDGRSAVLPSVIWSEKSHEWVALFFSVQTLEFTSVASCYVWWPK